LLDQVAVDGFANWHRDKQISLKNTAPPHSRAMSGELYVLPIPRQVRPHLFVAQKDIRLKFFSRLNAGRVPPVVLFNRLIDIDL
jgi:hypothetical protein